MYVMSDYVFGRNREVAKISGKRRDNAVLRARVMERTALPFTAISGYFRLE